jgi:hypothetical protein
MRTSKRLIGLAIAALAIPAAIIPLARASDHADTPEMVQRPGTDLTDVYVFPSPENPNNVVLVMNVNPLITPGNASSASFDPGVLYQFKLDTNGDNLEDRVIQASFEGTGASQVVKIAGPMAPAEVGTTNTKLVPNARFGTINESFFPRTNMRVFAGVREDPFFFDLEQFFTIFPDRATPITGQPVENPNEPQATTWRAPGEAVDFLSNGGYNVLTIVVELPKEMLVR